MERIQEKFRIIVPIFNEAGTLENILGRINKAGYLDRINFVNDASTDSSREILERWEENFGITVLHLNTNMRKEGAIREVLEQMARQKRLPAYVFLLDADSFIETNERSIDDIFNQGKGYMSSNELAGLALRIDALIDDASNALQKCVYVDYAAVQVDNWVTSKQWQLWLINGPGGLFRSERLMIALRTMTPDFETGDLQISVNLMKQGLRIGFLPDITVKTTVPASISEYFHQRRRWERGTIKVLWKDRAFYGSSFRTYRILALLTIIHLSIYVGIIYLAIVAMLYEDALSLITAQIIIVGIFWYVINMVKLYSNSKIRNSAFALKVPVWAMWNGVVWLFITSPARIFGCVEAISQLRAEARSNI